MISTKDMLNTLIGTKHFKKSIAGSRKSDKPFVDLYRPLIVYPNQCKIHEILAYGELKGDKNMCDHCENEFEFNPEEDVIVDIGGAVRSVLMDVGDALMTMCKGFDIGEIKINVSQDYVTGELKFKAKVDDQKVLEMKANDFVPYFGN